MLDALNRRFAIPDRIVFREHPSGLIQASIATPHCTGSLFLHGAHVAEYQPAGAKPVLFVSEKSQFSPGVPIRGGVPICFPWFGPHPSDTSAPAHGLARTALWQLHSVTQDDHGAIAVTLKHALDDWKLTYSASFGNALRLSLEIENAAAQTRECEAALHTYFALADVHAAEVHGLEGLSHLDKLSGTTLAASGQPISFAQETDRIYFGRPDALVIHDTGNARRIRIQPESSNSTVVWNPWIEKSQRMQDFCDEEYLKMCCVETCNVGPDRIALAPQAVHKLSVEISVHAS